MVDTTQAGPMAGAEASALETAAGPHKGAGMIGQLGWALYDGARSPYNVLVNIFVFSAYFATVVVPDSVRGQEVWSGITATSAFLVAIGAPILGAIADAGGRRKPWLLACVLLGAPCMVTIWFAVPAMQPGLMWTLVVAALVGAGMSFEYSAVFCNAMLPNVAPRGRIGFLSGLGLALGNAMGILVFLVYLLAWSWNPHPLFGLSNALHEPERAVGVLAAIWFVVFAIPLFLFTPDSPGTARSIPQAVGHGLKTLGATLVKLGDYKNLMTFLIARMTFNEGFIAMMLFTGVFAAGILHWTATMLIAEGLINSVVAALAGLFAGWLDTRAGSKRSTMFFVAGVLICNVVLASVTPHMVFFMPIDEVAVATGGLFPTLPDKVFLVAQCAIAFFVTGGLVTARSMMAKLAPRTMLNEFFGLYALSGTATSFIGPLAIGLVTFLYQSQRAGLIVGIVFSLIGLLVMLLVREQAAEA